MYLVHPKRLKASPVATYLSYHLFMSWKRSHFQLLHILVLHSFQSITTYDMHPPTDYTKYAAPGYPSAPMSIPPAQLYPPFAVHVPTPTPNTSGKWSTSLCHCFDDPVNCLVTCICPCVTFGQIAEIISQGENSCLASGGIYGVLLGVTGLACLYSCFYRSRMRGQYELEEAPCDDCVLHLCCETCALCQEYRELKNRGFDMRIGWEANMNRQQGRATTVAPFQGTMRR